MPEVGEKLYKMREASAILGVHSNTIRRWDREGKIKVVRAEGGHRRIPESEINRILNQTLPSAVKPPSTAISKDDELSTFLKFVFSYHKDDWDLVKRAVIIRDNYTCQDCGSREMIEVHHKDGTSRNDLENLITLCQKCHRKVHQQTIPQPKDREKEVKPKPPPQETKKPAVEETQVAPSAPEVTKLPRLAILNALAPIGLVQRTTFGNLLSAAAVLKRFTCKDLTARARCPEAITNTFCERMSSLGYLTNKDGIFELRVEVLK